MNEPELRHISANDASPRSFGGIRVTTKVHSGETEGAYAILEFVVPPGAGAPQLHRHPAHETYQLLEGTYEFLTVRDGECFSVQASAPEIVHIPGGVWHSGRNVGTSPSRHQIVMAPGSVEELFVELSHPVSEGKAEQPDSMVSMERFIEVGNKHGVEWLDRT